MSSFFNLNNDVDSKLFHQEYFEEQRSKNELSDGAIFARTDRKSQVREVFEDLDKVDNEEIVKKMLDVERVTLKAKFLKKNRCILL